MFAPLRMLGTELHHSTWNYAIPQLLILAVYTDDDLSWVAGTSLAELDVCEEEVFVPAIILAS